MHCMNTATQWHRNVKCILKITTRHATSTARKGNEHADSTFLDQRLKRRILMILELHISAETTNGSTRIILRLPPPSVPIRTCPFSLPEPKPLLYSTT